MCSSFLNGHLRKTLLINTLLLMLSCKNGITQSGMAGGGSDVSAADAVASNQSINNMEALCYVEVPRTHLEKIKCSGFFTGKRSFLTSDGCGYLASTSKLSGNHATIHCAGKSYGVSMNQSDHVAFVDESLSYRTQESLEDYWQAPQFEIRGLHRFMLLRTTSDFAGQIAEIDTRYKASSNQLKDAIRDGQCFVWGYKNNSDGVHLNEYLAQNGQSKIFDDPNNHKYAIALDRLEEVSNFLSDGSGLICRFSDSYDKRVLVGMVDGVTADGISIPTNVDRDIQWRVLSEQSSNVRVFPFGNVKGEHGELLKPVN